MIQKNRFAILINPAMMNYTMYLCQEYKIDLGQEKDETFDAEKTLKEDGTHYIFSKFDTDTEPEFNRRGRVRKRGFEETFEHSNGRTRKSARPRFISRR